MSVQQGGATEITIHGRTKADGYRADCINWEKIGEVRSRLTIPVIAMVKFGVGKMVKHV